MQNKCCYVRTTPNEREVFEGHDDDDPPVSTHQLLPCETFPGTDEHGLHDHLTHGRPKLNPLALYCCYCCSREGRCGGGDGGGDASETLN